MGKYTASNNQNNAVMVTVVPVKVTLKHEY